MNAHTGVGLVISHSKWRYYRFPPIKIDPTVSEIVIFSHWYHYPDRATMFHPRTVIYRQILLKSMQIVVQSPRPPVDEILLPATAGKN